MNRLHSFALSAATLTLALSATSALAHPGHGLVDGGAVHIITSPYHLTILAGTGAALYFGAFVLPKKLPRFSLQIIGGLALVAAGVLWGLRA